MKGTHPLTNPYSGNSDNQPENFPNNGSEGSDYETEYKVPPMDSMPTYNANNDPTQLLGPVRPGPGIRLLSYIIDSIILGVVGGVIAYLIYGSEIYDMFDPDTPSDSLDTLTFIMSLIGLVVWLVYRALMESSSLGASLGKLITGQRVTNFEGGTITFTQSLTRNAYYIIYTILSFVPIVGLILAIAYYVYYGVSISRDPYNQSQTDRWAKTYVINRH